MAKKLLKTTQDFINSQLPKTKKDRKSISPLMETMLVGNIITNMYKSIPEVDPVEIAITAYEFRKHSKHIAQDYSMSSVVHPHEIDRDRQLFTEIEAVHSKFGEVRIKGIDSINADEVMVRITFLEHIKEGKKKSVIVHRKVVPINQLDIMTDDEEKSGDEIQRIFLESSQHIEYVEPTNLFWHNRGLVEITQESYDRNGTLTYLVEPVNEAGESYTPRFDIGVEEMGSMDDHCMSHGRSFEVYESELTPYEYNEIPDTAKLCQPYTKGGVDDRSNTTDEYVWVTRFMPRKPVLDINGDQVIREARTRSGSVILYDSNRPVQRKWFSQGEWKIIDKVERVLPIKSAHGVKYVKKDCVAQPVYESPMVEVIGENSRRRYITKAFWLLDIKTGEKLRWVNPEAKKNKSIDVSEPTELSDVYDEFYYNPDALDDYQGGNLVASIETSVYETVPLEGYVDTIDSITTKGRILNAKDQIKFNKELKARDLDDTFKLINTDASYWKVPKISARSLSITRLKINFIQGAKVGPGLKLADVSFYKAEKKKTFTIEVYVSDKILGELEIRCPWTLPDDVKIFFAQQVSYEFAKARITKAK